MSLQRELLDFIPWMGSEALSQITGLLRYPVLIVLFGLTMWVIIEIGMVSFEWLARTGRFPKRELKDLEEGIHNAKILINKIEINEEKLKEFKEESRAIKACTTSKFVHMFLNGLSTLSNDKQFPIRLERLIQAYNAETAGELERTRTMVRIGPMLGLMGTLIPMGPALLALTQGDIDALASNLIFAFGTTVLGLLVGAIAYVITTLRQHWYDRDIDDIRYICEMLFGGE